MTIKDRFRRAFFPAKNNANSWLNTFASLSPFGDNPTASACENLIASKLGNLPLYPKVHIKGGGLAMATFSSLWYPLTRKPNAEETPTQLLITLVKHIVRHGNGFLKILKVKNSIVGWEIVHPDCVQISRDSSGRKIFIIGGIVYDSRDILHFPYPTNYDGNKGTSPREIAREIICLDNALLGYMRSYFSNSLGDRLTLTSTSKGTDKTDLAKFYSEIVPIANNILEQGNAGKLLIPPPDTKFERITQPSNAEAELHSLKKLTEKLITQCYLVPYSLIDERESKYGSLEEKTQDFVESCLKPHGDCIQERFNTLLLPDESAIECLFDFEYMSAANVKTKEDILSARLSKGVININEYRNDIGLSGIGADGDTYRIYMSAYLPATVETDSALLASAKVKLDAQDTANQHSPNGDDKL